MYLVTNVDRATRCIIGWGIVHERTYETMQPILDGSPQAVSYHTDAFPTYETLVYFPGRLYTHTDKSQTFSVEADNAEIRHYLARFARASRCFSRSLDALRRALKIFIYAWNRRQLHIRQFPRYPAHVKDFVYP